MRKGSLQRAAFFLAPRYFESDRVTTMRPSAKFIFGLCLLMARHVLAWEPAATDYHVWSAAIDDPEGIVYVWHETESSSVYDRGENFGVGRDAETGRLAANASNQATAELRPDRFSTRATVRLLDRDTLERLVGRCPKPTWLLSPRAIEGTAAVYRLSLPAYSEDGRSAYFLCCECSMDHGSVELVTVTKDDAGKWYAQKIVRKDFIHWKKTSSFINE